VFRKAVRALGRRAPMWRQMLSFSLVSRDSYADTPPEEEAAVRFTNNMVTSSSLNLGSTKNLRLDMEWQLITRLLRP